MKYQVNPSGSISVTTDKATHIDALIDECKVTSQTIAIRNTDGSWTTEFPEEYTMSIIKHVDAFGKEKKMDIGFAVFNCHINNAEERAIALFVETYGQAVFNDAIQPCIDAGIMSIFDGALTERTEFFVKSIQKFVNENRI